MMLTPARVYEIASSFLDAVEQGDIATVRALYAPGMLFWVNISDEEKSGEENIATQIAGKTLARRKTYNDRHIDMFEDGFLARYTVNIVTLDGKPLALSACIVAKCDCDGRIVRIDEYLDAGRLPSRAKKQATS